MELLEGFLKHFINRNKTMINKLTIFILTTLIAQCSYAVAAFGDNANTNDNSSNSIVSYNTNTQPGANAPSILSLDICQGVSSFAIQKGDFGVAFGGSKKLEFCKITILYAIAMHDINAPELAYSILCQEKIFRKADKGLNSMCPKSKRKTESVVYRYPKSRR